MYEGITRYFYELFDSFIMDMALEVVVLSHVALIFYADSPYSSIEFVFFLSFLQLNVVIFISINSTFGIIWKYCEFFLK